jgi:alkaline phosphatase
MGTQEITAARCYQYGAAGRMNVDRLPFTGFQTTWSVKPGDAPRYLPDYDPDSASTGTMWATGTKTIDERISQGPSESLEVPGSNDLPTVLERAQEAGKKVGNVSTAEITDATPAVLDSHISNRACQGPADAAKLCPEETKAAGGLGSIAERTVDHGGRRHRDGLHRGRRRGRVARPQALRRARPRPLQQGHHDHGVDRARGHEGRRHPAAGVRQGQPAGERTEPRRDDAEGDPPPSGLEGRLLPAGGGRLHRQAGPRTRARRSARPSRSTAPSASRSTTSARIPTP